MKSEVAQPRARMLLVIRELFIEAEQAMRLETDVAAMRATLLLDLAVELMLNALVHDASSSLPPDERAKRERSFERLWQLAQASFKEKTQRARLPSIDAVQVLRDQRNLVQHNGTPPNVGAIRSHLPRVHAMLAEVYVFFYGADFEHFAVWDLLAREELRRFMREVETLRERGQQVAVVVACVYIFARVMAVIAGAGDVHRGFLEQRVRYAIERAGASRQAQLDPTTAAALGAAVAPICEDIERLRIEAVAAGLGIPAADTRRFVELRTRCVLGVAESTAGEWDFAMIGTPTAEDAPFMLAYLSKLLYFAETAFPREMAALRFYGYPLDQAWTG